MNTECNYFQASARQGSLSSRIKSLFCLLGTLKCGLRNVCLKYIKFNNCIKNYFNCYYMNNRINGLC